jgi:zinc and cadmium transporter
MAQIYLYTLASVFIVSALSLLGVVTLGLSERYLKSILFYLVSLSAGALLGDVFLHLLPQLGGIGLGVREGAYFLGGIVIFFVLERFILWHHAHGDHDEQVHSVVYLAIIGDSLHNFIDGLIIAASFLVSIPLGIATTLAVIFHEIPHEIGQFAILIHGGWSRGKATMYNFLSALTSVLGAVVVLVFARSLKQTPTFLLAFAGSSFIYIALSDLIPELHKERSTRKSIYQFCWFLIGIGFMAAILFLE